MGSGYPKVGPNVLRDYLELCLEQGVAILVEGTHGIGKSSIPKELASEKSIGFKVVDLSLIEPVDLTGLPFISPEAVTRYAKSEILPTESDPEKGILVFEELNRCPAAVRNPCLQLLTEGKLNSYVLPSGWVVMACINPSDGQYDTDDLDPALLDRFLKVELQTDVESWILWATNHKVDPRILSFISSNHARFSWCTPRSWVRISNLIRGLSYQKIDSLGKDFLLAAGLSSSAALELLNHLKDGILVDAEKFFNDPNERELYLQEASDLIKKNDFGKLDIIVKAILIGEKAYRRRPRRVLEAIDSLLRLLPPDYRLSFGSDGIFRIP